MMRRARAQTQKSCAAGTAGSRRSTRSRQSSCRQCSPSGRRRQTRWQQRLQLASRTSAIWRTQRTPPSPPPPPQTRAPMMTTPLPPPPTASLPVTPATRQTGSAAARLRRSGEALPGGPFGLGFRVEPGDACSAGCQQCRDTPGAATPAGAACAWRGGSTDSCKKDRGLGFKSARPAVRATVTARPDGMSGCARTELRMLQICCGPCHVCVNLDLALLIKKATAKAETSQPKKGILFRQLRFSRPAHDGSYAFQPSRAAVEASRYPPSGHGKRSERPD